MSTLRAQKTKAPDRTNCILHHDSPLLASRVARRRVQMVARPTLSNHLRRRRFRWWHPFLHVGSDNSIQFNDSMARSICEPSFSEYHSQKRTHGVFVSSASTADSLT